MSLPQTLEVAKNKLDEAEGLLESHSDQVVLALNNEEVEYGGDYEEELVKKATRAGLQVTNARTQFFNYEEDFEEVINGQGISQEVRAEYDIPATLHQYQRAYESAESLALRYERLQDQIKGLSQVMEQNGMGSLWDKLKEENPWFEEPEWSEGFRPATEL